jgi:AhpD family alkylhydroperoxidase
MQAEMDERTKELIAIGASIGAHCQPCLTYHLGKAKEVGVSVDLINAAVEIGQMVEKGSMAAMRNFTRELVGNQSPGSQKSCAGKTKKGTSCCG